MRGATFSRSRVTRQIRTDAWRRVIGRTSSRSRSSLFVAEGFYSGIEGKLKQRNFQKPREKLQIGGSGDVPAAGAAGEEGEQGWIGLFPTR